MRTKLQQEIIDEASRRLQGTDWFRGLCLDNLMNDHQIMQDREAAIEALIMDTYYWDGDW